MIAHPWNAERRRRPVLWLWIGLALLLPTGLAAAQDDNGAEFGPFTAVVTGDDVYVRAGGSKKYYWITQLNTGDLVRVLDEKYGWYLIDAPERTFSWISKQYVDADPDGKTGTVTGNNVLVRAPSPAGPGRTKSYKSQTSLDTGAKVTIVGEAPGWYKIEPPEGATAYIHGDYVRKASAAEIRAAREGEAGETPDEPAGNTEAEAQAQGPGEDEADGGESDGLQADGTGAAEAATDVDGDVDTDGEGAIGEEPATAGAEPGDGTGADAADTTPETPEPVTAGEQTGDAPPDGGASEVVEADDDEAIESGEAAETGEPTDDRVIDAALAAIEQRFAETSRRPLIDQPVPALLAEYRRLSEREGLNEQQRALVTMRVELLETRRNLQETLLELKRAETELEAERAAEAEGDGGTEASGEPTKAEDYTAVGRLLASSLYTGERLPKLYRLVDPLSDMTIGYVEPTGEVDLRRMLGRVVGIVGSSEYHPGLKLRLIKVERIDSLAAQR